MIRFKEFHEACWDTHKQIGMKKKGNREVPNCVPKNEEAESVEESKDFSKYTMKPVKTEPKIVRKTNPSGRTTDHVEYEVHGTLSSHKKTFKSKKEAEAYFNTVKEEAELDEGSESWEAGYARRVVKTSKPEHKEKGYNWRIKGKDRPEISIKLYKEKPSQAEFNNQMKRVAGHEFGG